MRTNMHLRQLSAPRQTLVRLFQSINHGQIEDLEVRSGEPAFSPAPRVLIDAADWRRGPTVRARVR